MQPFELHIPTKFYFGDKYAAKFGEHIVRIGKKVFIVTGGGTVKRLGYLDLVCEHIKKAGAEFEVFQGIEANPDSETINRASVQARNYKADVILALGGGSVMDASKAIAFLTFSGEKDIWEYVKGESKHNRFNGALPVACIPTTAATASEVTPYGVISNRKVSGKAPIASPHFRPFASWINPAFTLDVPLVTSRDGASDIFSHVIENYLIGGNDSPLADYYSEGVMRTVIDTLPAVSRDLRSYDLRARLMWASTLALNGYQQAGRIPGEFVIHAIEHAMSAINPDLAHGRGLATLYPSYFRWMWNHGRVKERLARLGRTLFQLHGDQDATGYGFITHFEEWLKRNGLYQTSSSVGVHPDRFEEVARYTVDVYGEGGFVYAAGPLSAGDIMDILRQTETQIP